MLVIDDATLPNDVWMVRAARQAAQPFIEQLGPADRAAVVERTGSGFLGAGPQRPMHPGVPIPGPPAGSLGSDLYYYLSSTDYQP